jgi:hypothetical protein
LKLQHCTMEISIGILFGSKKVKTGPPPGPYWGLTGALLGPYWGGVAAHL